MHILKIQMALSWFTSRNEKERNIYICKKSQLVRLIKLNNQHFSNPRDFEEFVEF